MKKVAQIWPGTPEFAWKNCPGGRDLTNQKFFLGGGSRGMKAVEIDWDILKDRYI